MKAVCWMGKHDMQVHTVPDPKIINPQDADHQDYADGDLWKRSAPLRRVHSEHGIGRHHGPRVSWELWKRWGAR